MKYWEPENYNIVVEINWSDFLALGFFRGCLIVLSQSNVLARPVWLYLSVLLLFRKIHLVCSLLEKGPTLQSSRILLNTVCAKPAMRQTGLHHNGRAKNSDAKTSCFEINHIINFASQRLLTDIEYDKFRPLIQH